MPIPGWNDPFPADLEWWRIEFQQMIWNAFNERYARQQWPSPTLNVPAAGDIIGRAYATNDSHYGFSVSFIQSYLENMCPSWLDPTVDWTTKRFGHELHFTLGSWRAAAGIAPGGFRRKKPRQIQNPSATVDVDGNTAAAGQKAYYAWWEGYDHHTRLYEYDGANWVPTAGRPDVLDSHAAPPNTVAGGIMRAGDYIGPWLFEEIRDGLNLLVVRAVQWYELRMHSDWRWTQIKRRYVSGGSRAQAEAAWNTAPVQDVPDDDENFRGIAMVSGEATTYPSYPIRFLESISAMVWAKRPTTLNSQVELWMAGRKPAGWFGYGTPVFDANGQPLVEDRFRLIATIPAGNTSPIITDRIGDENRRPNWLDSPPAAYTPKGWVADGGYANDPYTQTLVVLRFDVEGGFGYVPA